MFASAQSAAVYSYDVPWFMYAIVVAALVIYAIIEAINMRTDHVIGFKEAVRWSVVYVSAALLFAIPIYVFIGTQATGEYLGAWAIEKALSLDNLFVISLIFASFRVPAKFQRRMLNYGIAGAIFFRLLFILAGVELLKRFEWIGIIFGLILVRAAWNAYKEARRGHDESEEDIKNSKLWKGITRIFPVHPEFDGHKFTTIVNGKRMLTMMGAIVILIECTDIVFAVDSVPAVLAISPDRFIAYSSNVFALLGLRALFFVYQSVSSKFWALNWALAAILAWIGFKMIAAPLGLHIPIGISLTILFLLLSAGLFVSLKWPHDSDNVTTDTAGK